MPCAYVGWFVWGVKYRNWRHLSWAGCNIYVDVAKTIIASSGIATAILSTALTSPGFRTQTVVWGMALLVASIMLCVLVILVLTRVTQVALAREEDQAGDEWSNVKQGSLSNLELFPILTLTLFGLETFFVGFFYLGLNAVGITSFTLF